MKLLSAVEDETLLVIVTADGEWRTKTKSELLQDISENAYSISTIHIAKLETFTADIDEIVDSLVRDGYEDMDLDIMADIKSCPEIYTGIAKLNEILKAHPIAQLGEQVINNL